MEIILLNPLIMKPDELTRLYRPRDEIEAHILAALQQTLEDLDDADDLHEKDTANLRDQLEALRNVLDEVGLPPDPDDLHLALRDADKLALLLAEATEA